MNWRDAEERGQDDPFYGMLVGKQAALADWQFRKEQKDFSVLVNRLRVKKWQAEALKDPERALAVRERKRIYAAKPEVRARAYELARKRRREIRLKLLRAVQGCLECGATWCSVPWLRRAYPRDYCTESCRQRAKYRAAKALFAAGAV